MSTRLFSIRPTVLVAGMALMAAVLPAEERHVVGRVAIERTNIAADDARNSVEASLTARFAPAPGEPFPRQRLLHLADSLLGRPGQYTALVHDYETAESWEVEFDGAAVELSRKPVELTEFHITAEEQADAMRFIRDFSEFAPAIADGTLVVHASMPPVTFGPDGERLCNLIVSSPLDRAVLIPEIHDTWMVSFRDEKLIPYANGTEAKRLTRNRGGEVCGTAAQAPCTPARHSGVQTYAISWPAEDPVWQFNVLRPEDARPNFWGTGIDLSNVRYRGRLVLDRAHLPSFGIKYDNDACGPYRDWLFTEDCFAVGGGTRPVPGFHVNTGPGVVQTICQGGSDTGNFNGVAITDEGNSLWLVTETDAGWYRYIMEWRFHLDGTLEPIFTFGDTPDPCTCNNHDHHANWRFEFALDGATGDNGTGICTVERSDDGGGSWTSITTELAYDRNAAMPTDSILRITNGDSAFQWILQSGPNDRSSDGNTFSPADFYILAKNINPTNSDEIYDGDSPQGGISQFINGQAIGTDRRLVVWYHAYLRDTPNPGLGANDCGQLGPRLFLLPTMAADSDRMTVFPLVP